MDHATSIPSRWEEAQSLLWLAIPVIGAQVAQMSMSLVDTVMAGHLGAEALAAIGLGSALWMPYLLLLIGTLMSVSPNVAQRFGAGDHLAVGHHVRQGLWLAAVAGIAGCALLQISGPCLRYLLDDTPLTQTTIAFLQAIAWGIPALCGMTVLRGFTEGVSRTQPVLWVSALGLLTNIAGNWILMYGRFGFPRLGAVGCGWASATAAWLMFLSLGLHELTHSAYRRFRPFERFERPDFEEIGNLLRLGLPIGVTMMLEGGLCLMVALGMQRFGETALAANQVSLNVSGLTFMVPLGIHTAIAVRVGQAIGGGRIAEARQAGLVGMGLAMACMVISGLVLCLFPDRIARFYTTEATVIALAIPLLHRAALFQLADGLQVASHGALRGAKDTFVPTLITIVAYWLIAVPLGYLLAFPAELGPTGIWNGLVTGLMVAGGLLCWRFFYVMRRLMASSGGSETQSALEAVEPVAAAANFHVDSNS